MAENRAVPYYLPSGTRSMMAASTRFDPRKRKLPLVLAFKSFRHERETKNI
jgi:hypothetical protein